MSKLMKTIVISTILLLVGAVSDVYLSTFLHLTLKREFIGASQLNTIDCFKSLMRNRQHQLLYWTILLLLLAVCTALFLMGGNKEDYASEITKITEKISTPVAIGQGQHGTAKWLPKGEYQRIFYTVEIIPEAEPYRGLLSRGYDDLPNDLQGGKTPVEQKKGEAAVLDD